MSNEILEKLRKEGILIAEPVAYDKSGLLLNIDGEELCFYLAPEARAYYVLPHYKSNRGFFHVFSDGGECLFLKSCYEDSIRVLKKGMTAADDVLVSLSRTLLKIEGILKEPAAKPAGSIGSIGSIGSYGLWMLHGKFDTYVVKVKDIVFTPDEHIDPTIPRPLTSTEYEAAKSEDLRENTMFTRSLFNTVAPEMLSYLASSILKQYPDLMHTFFTALELKTQSPSQKTIAGRAYLNLSGALAAMKEARINLKLFAKEYMPWQKIFDKDKAPNAELFITSNIPTQEITEFIDEIAQKYTEAPHLIETEHAESFIHLSMVGLMLAFLFYEQWYHLVKLTGLGNNELLTYIYRTRADSVFITGASFHLPRFFDPAEANHELSVAGGATVMPIDNFIAKIPTFNKLRHKKAIIKTLSSLHETLTLRDKLLQTAGNFHKIMRETLENNAQFAIEKNKIRDISELFLFDLDEVKKIVHDSYIPGIEQLIEYRKSFQYRVAAQAAPYEIYEKDISSIAMISEEQLSKGGEKTAFVCTSLNHKPRQATVGVDGVLCARVFTLADIAAFTSKPDAIITDISPAFSYLTEYCIVNDIALYTGLRYCEQLLKGKRVELTENEIRLS